MRNHYRNDLHTVKDLLLEQSGLVEQAVVQAQQALLATDLVAAEEVIRADAQIDALQNRIDEHCFELTLLQQPVAKDLRVTITGMRMAALLERMGDLAVHIAKQVRLRYPEPSMTPYIQPLFAQMCENAQAIAKLTQQAIAQRSSEVVAELNQREEQMDAFQRDLFTWIQTPGQSISLAAAIDLALLARYFERFADHAVSLGEQINFITTGDMVATTE